jgi:hypothetical protein
MAPDLKERDRRYRLIWGKIAERGFDALVVIANADINRKGFVENITNYRSILDNLIVIFPMKGEPRLLVPSPVQQYRAGLLSWIPDVQEEVLGIGESVVRSLANIGLGRSKLCLVNDKIIHSDVHFFAGQGSTRWQDC